MISIAWQYLYNSSQNKYSFQYTFEQVDKDLYAQKKINKKLRNNNNNISILTLLTDYSLGDWIEFAETIGVEMWFKNQYNLK